MNNSALDVGQTSGVRSGPVFFFEASKPHEHEEQQHGPGQGRQKRLAGVHQDPEPPEEPQGPGDARPKPASG